MPTQNDFFEALLEGRWQPELTLREEKGQHIATYKQGDLVVERSSPWSVSQAEGDLMEEIKRGTLEGDYYPVQG